MRHLCHAGRLRAELDVAIEAHARLALRANSTSPDTRTDAEHNYPTQVLAAAEPKTSGTRHDAKTHHIVTSRPGAAHHHENVYFTLSLLLHGGGRTFVDGMRSVKATNRFPTAAHCDDPSVECPIFAPRD
jgi:hypothetical protein